jgi:hypothetical protein
MFKIIFTFTVIFSVLASKHSFAGSSRTLLDCGTAEAHAEFIQESSTGDSSKGAICFVTFLGGVQNLACPTLTDKIDLGQSTKFAYTTTSETLTIVIPKSLNAPNNTDNATVTGEVQNENGETVNVNEVLKCNSHTGSGLVFGLSTSSD